MYGKGIRPENPFDAIRNVTFLLRNPDILRRRAKAGFEAASSFRFTDPTRLAGAGYCLGGTIVLELARSESTTDALKAVVSFHGDPVQVWPDGYNKFKGSVAVLHGALDAQSMTFFPFFLPSAFWM